VPGKDYSWPRLEWLIAFTVTLWLVFLHLQHLFHAGPLWRDEVGSIDFAAMPALADIWRKLQYDNFPPLFVLVARFWLRTGLTSDFDCRVLGFLIGLATLAVIWFGARAGGRRVPLLALALYALNPLAIRVGDSLRPYGLGIALTSLTFVLTWKFVEGPRPRSLWWAVFAAVLSVQCLYQSAVFLIAFSFGAWAVTAARREWKTAAQASLIGICAALSLLPHLPNLLRAAAWRQTAVHPVTFLQERLELLNALDAGATWLAWVWAVLAILALALALISFLPGFSIISIRLFPRSIPAIVLYSATALMVSIPLYLVFLQQIGLAPRPWYFLILVAPSALALEFIFSAVQSSKLYWTIILCAGLLPALSAPACLAGVRLRQTNADLVAQTLQEQAQPEDLIIVSPWYFGVSLQRYFDAGRFTTLPPLPEVRIHRYDLMEQAMETADPIGPLLEQVRQTLRSGHTLWVAGLFQLPPPGPPQPVYGPYHGGMANPDSAYFSSWMFQISRIVQTRATSGGQIKIAVPSDAPINPLEDIPLLAFHGWRE
jgi:4-amino-4-deoxy-L-arabinose transferase-like glycosyltransferase